jgi:type VI protein secretion system component Hcp
MTDIHFTITGSITYTLSNARIVEIGTGGGASADPLTEEISFVFQSVVIESVDSKAPQMMMCRINVRCMIHARTRYALVHLLCKSSPRQQV